MPDSVIRYVYYAFIFSIPYEILDIGLGGRNITITKIIGYILILVALHAWRICFQPPPAAFWYFAGYLGMYAIFGALQEVQLQGAIIGRFITSLQLLVLFWVSYNLLRYDKIATGALLALITSCNTVVLVSIAGQGNNQSAGRASALGENPNIYGVVMSLGLLALVGISYGGKIANKRIRFLAWMCSGGLATAVAYSGSRGAAVALGIGLMALLVTRKMVTQNIKTTAIILLVVGLVVSAIYSSDFVRVRWEKTIRTGDVAGRDRIFWQSLDMFSEKPIIGWGPVAHNYELGSRLGLTVRDTHNLYFHILHESGLLGGTLFFSGLALCLRAALLAQVGVRGKLPLSMMCFLLIINTKGTYHYQKLAWFVLAYVLASGYVHGRLRSHSPTDLNRNIPIQNRATSGASTVTPAYYRFH